MKKETKLLGTFEAVPGGYARKIDDHTTLFVNGYNVASFCADTGELTCYTPDYDALEAAKAPAVQADAPGEYRYYYETNHAPTGCDFSASLSYYGDHYYLRPLRDDLPQLHGRGIKYDEERNTYRVTTAAYDKIKAAYRVSYEMCFD